MVEPSPSGRDILIVGGGPAGLAAAVEASRRGHAVRLLEAGPRLGGMAAGLTVAGQSVDLGSHRLHPQAGSARVHALLADLLGDDLQQRRRHGRIRIGGHWLSFPFGPLEALRRLPPRLSGRLIADQVRSRQRDAETGNSDTKADTYADVVRNGLGPAALDAFHGPMARKLWGIASDELDGELARRRITVRDPASVLRTLVRAARPGGATFLYPRLGYGQIVDALAEAAIGGGVSIETGAVAVGLETGARPAVVLADGRCVSADRLLWTAPLAELGRLRDETGAGLRWRGLILVYLVVGQDQYSPYDAHYVPDPDVAFSRLSEPKNYRDGPDPAGTTVLCAEIPEWPGEGQWLVDDRTLGDLVVAGMAACGMARPVVEAVRVVRLPAVYPVLPAGTGGVRRRGELDRLAGLEGVTVLGRHGRFTADNLHHVLDMGLTAADCLDHPSGWDSSRWAEAETRFESFTVED